MWSKGQLVFGLCGKDKSDTLFSLINYVHGTKEKIYMFIYTHLQIIES